MSKAQVRYITLERAEGKIEECGKPITVKTYEEANQVLSEMAATIPKEKNDVTYKVDFVIFFYDNENYIGTYEIRRNDIVNADLSGHIMRINDISRYPEGIREHAVKSGRVEKFKNFAKTHDLGFD